MWRFRLECGFVGRRVDVRNRAALFGAIVCLGAPVAAQVTSLPFGQSGNIATALPFGQKSRSPLRPLALASSTFRVVAQWNMNETSGTTMVESSGNNNNGTLYNVQTTGTGYVFNGTSSKVVVPNSATLNPGSRDFSYTVHLKTSTLPPSAGDYDIIRKGAANTAGGGYRMEILNHNGIGEAYCSVSDSAGHTFSVRGNTNIVDGALHTVTCKKTSTALTLTVDSLTPWTTSGTIVSISNSKPLVLGSKSPTDTTATQDWYRGRLHGATISVSQ